MTTSWRKSIMVTGLVLFAGLSLSMAQVPTVDFTGTPLSGTAPLAVSFTLTSTNATSGVWDFGDSQTSTQRNPVHTYTSAGTYTVSVTVTGPGGSATQTKPAYITVSAQVPPTVDFTGTPLSGTAPLDVSFTSTFTNATSGAWDFGDGGTATTRNPVHTYQTAGTYTVSLTGTGPGGSTTTTKVDYISVTGPPPPVPDFSATPTSGPAPLTVQFTWLTTGTSTGGGWDFGEGGSISLSSLQDPTFTYRTPGTYTVTLRADGPGGTAYETKTDFITVLPPIPGPLDFSEVTIASGLTSTFATGNTHTGGIAWWDYNEDYWPDLFITNGSGFDHYLYRNNGDGTFSDVSYLVPKIDILDEDAAGYFADIDNDGDTDLLVVVDNATTMVPSGTNPKNGGPNRLYVNQGDGTFVENAAAAGVLDPFGHRNITGGFADYDRDGNIDLYLGAWAMNSLPLGAFDKLDRTLKGNGDGTFTNTSATTTVDDLGRDTLTALWFDANMDGWPDLYITNVSYVPNPPLYESRDLFYRNNRDGTFSQKIDVTVSGPGVGNDADNGMGMDVGDIDNDGDWDLFITDNYATVPIPRGDVLYLGTPGGQLIDNVCDAAGVCSDDSWACKFEDFDRDGLVDLWVGASVNYKSDFLYTNNGDGTFKDNVLSSFIGNATLGGSTADYDGDGDVDIAWFNYTADARLYRNDSTNTNNWLSFKLFGTTSNRSAIGATIRVTSNGVTQMRRVTGGDSAHSQSENILHFGIGSQTSATVTITWPSGIVTNLGSVPINRLLFVNETTGLLAESLMTSSATWSTSTQELTVSALTNYHGRTNLSVTGFGPLGYDVTALDHAAVFGGVLSDPGSVTLTSDTGGSWVLPVTVVP